MIDTLPLVGSHDRATEGPPTSIIQFAECVATPAGTNLPVFFFVPDGLLMLVGLVH